MTQRVKTVKTETVAEYLARGGKITKVPNGGEYTPDSFVGPNAKAPKPTDYEDHRDGNAPNARWIGDKE